MDEVKIDANVVHCFPGHAGVHAVDRPFVIIDAVAFASACLSSLHGWRLHQ